MQQKWNFLTCKMAEITKPKIFNVLSLIHEDIEINRNISSAWVSACLGSGSARSTSERELTIMDSV
jgi:hypothetical protein